MNPAARQASCEGKTAFNYPAAKRVAKAMRNQDKGRVVPYHCGCCGRWHIGNHAAPPLDRRREHGKNIEGDDG